MALSGKGLNFQMKQLKMASKVVGASASSVVWSGAGDDCVQVFSELSRAQSLLGAYGVGVVRG